MPSSANSFCLTGPFRFTHSRSFSVLSGMDDIVYPLLYACDSKNPKIVQLALSSLQRLIPNGAIPEVP